MCGVDVDEHGYCGEIFIYFDDDVPELHAGSCNRFCSIHTLKLIIAFMCCLTWPQWWKS